MSVSKLTDRTELATTPASDDVLHIVDVDDTTGSAAGTSKKIRVSNLVSSSSGVTAVTGTAPIASSGGFTPDISITAATTSAAGSMSSADKTKLDGIATGAEVNVNADWNASSGDAEILNKPNTNELDGQILEYITRSTAFSNGSIEGEVLKYGGGTLVETKAYVYGSSAWTAVDADLEAKTRGLFGIALGTSGLVSGLLIRGVMQHTSFSSFAIGDILYISTTEGTITNTAPTATGDFVRVIGYALGNSYIMVHPSATYIELA